MPAPHLSNTFARLIPNLTGPIDLNGTTSALVGSGSAAWPIAGAISATTAAPEIAIVSARRAFIPELPSLRSPCDVTLHPVLPRSKGGGRRVSWLLWAGGEDEGSRGDDFWRAERSNLQ